MRSISNKERFKYKTQDINNNQMQSPIISNNHDNETKKNSHHSKSKSRDENDM